MSSSRGNSSSPPERSFKDDQAGDAMTTFVKEFRKESERASVIIAAAMIDDAIGERLKLFLTPCATSQDSLFDGSNALLGTFSARIEFAYRLGLITARLSRDINIIRKIRNDFAHKLTGCDYSDEKVKSRIRELRLSFHPILSYKSVDPDSTSDRETLERCAAVIIFHLKLKHLKKSSLQECEMEWCYTVHPSKEPDKAKQDQASSSNDLPNSTET